MTAYFNELTLDSIPQQNLMLLREFEKVFTRFAEATGGKESPKGKIRRLIANESAMEALYYALLNADGGEREKLCPLFVQKFQVRPEDDYTDATLDHFKGAEYSLLFPDGEKRKCPTMGWGCLNRSLTLGLCSSRFWEQLTYEIEEESLDDGDSVHEAICVTKECQIDNPKVQSRIASMREFEDVPEPIPCRVPPEQKPIKFSDDHGREKLCAFCKSIVRHEYVCGVVNSLPYKDHENRFIVDCHDNGMVDLCLHWVSFSYGSGQRKGLSLRVQTVGKDKRQTEMIADILKDKYDRRS